MNELEKYPHLFMPPDAIPFDLNASFVFTQQTDLKLVDIPTKPGYVGVIRYVDIFSSDFSNSYFTLKKAAAPMRDYVRITMPMVPAIPVVIRIPDGTPMALYQTAIGAGISGRYRLVGWMWPNRK